MSKSPLKGADQALVQGAYRAAAAGIPRGGQDGMGSSYGRYHQNRDRSYG